MAERYPQITLIEFGGRTGKAQIINKLAEMCDSPVFIMTDANVFFHHNTFSHLCKHFTDPRVQLVAGNIIKQSPSNKGIAEQELAYINLENKIKMGESYRYDSIIGAEGGCYAIRKTNYAPVPVGYFMDDFYITMNVIENGGQAVFESEATCSEDVSTQSSEEYKRKIRISIGNFQNFA